MARPVRCNEHAGRIDAYLAAHEDAVNRIERGEVQAKCDECKLWSWPLAPERETP